MMAFKNIVLANAEEAFSVLRPTNRFYFGQVSPGRWLFRGQSREAYDLIPSVWRSNFLEEYQICDIKKIAWISRLARSADVIQNYYRYELTESQLMRSVEMVTRTIISKDLLRDFQNIAIDISLLEEMPRDYNFEIYGDISKLIDGWLTIIMSRLTGEISPDHIIALAQHYGVPTDLLDWTEDPLSALYFALEGSVDGDYIYVYAFDKSKYINRDKSQDDVTIRFVSGSKMTNSYLNAQKGAFTKINDGHKIFVQNGRYPRIDDVATEEELIRFAIPVHGDNTDHLIDGLQTERRTRAHLMPDYGNCSETARRNFKLANKKKN